MITLLADLVLRRVCTPPNTAPHHEWLPPPTPSPVLAEPFKESLVALLTELAWRRARATERQQESSNDQCEDSQHTSGAQSLRLCATVNIHAGDAASREHRTSI